MSIPYEVARWRAMGVTNPEIRRCIAVAQRDRHNKHVAKANMPKRGLDYERLQRQRAVMTAALLDAVADAVRPYAPEAP